MTEIILGSILGFILGFVVVLALFIVGLVIIGKLLK